MRQLLPPEKKNHKNIQKTECSKKPGLTKGQERDGS